jgi:hypothetical protein
MFIMMGPERKSQTRPAEWQLEYLNVERWESRSRSGTIEFYVHSISEYSLSFPFRQAKIQFRSSPSITSRYGPSSKSKETPPHAHKHLAPSPPLLTYLLISTRNAWSIGVSTILKPDALVAVCRTSTGSVDTTNSYTSGMLEYESWPAVLFHPKPDSGSPCGVSMPYELGFRRDKDSSKTTLPGECLSMSFLCSSAFFLVMGVLIAFVEWSNNQNKVTEK